jgi:hypothetical protein
VLRLDNVTTMEVGEKSARSAGESGPSEGLDTVHNPMGFPPRVRGKALASRLNSLDGKTIFLVDCHFDDSGLLLEQIQAWFGKHMPGVQTRLVEKANMYARDDPALWERIKAEGDAALIGVGH